MFRDSMANSVYKSIKNQIENKKKGKPINFDKQLKSKQDFYIIFFLKIMFVFIVIEISIVMFMLSYSFLCKILEQNSGSNTVTFLASSVSALIGFFGAFVLSNNFFRQKKDSKSFEEYSQLLKLNVGMIKGEALNISYSDFNFVSINAIELLLTIEKYKFSDKEFYEFCLLMYNRYVRLMLNLDIFYGSISEYKNIILKSRLL